jgi:hypothetical protein
MRREQRAEAGRGAAEEHVAGLRRVRALIAEPAGEAADLLERAGDAFRVARELHRRGVGQELALAAHGRLDQVAEERAEEADHRQAGAERQQRQRRRRPGPASGVRGVPEKNEMRRRK